MRTMSLSLGLMLALALALAGCDDDSNYCPSKLAQCGGKCVNTNTDPAHCGKCDSKCASGLVCAAGLCQVQCPSGQQRFGGGDAGGQYCADT